MGDHFCRSGLRIGLPAGEPESVDETLGMNCRASTGETRGYPGGSDEGVAHPRGGFSYVLAYNSADSESREPVLQHAMYYRLYHRSWFAGRKTYARHVSRWVTPASLRDKDRECHTDLGAPSALHRFQAHRLRRRPPVWFAYHDFGWPVLLLPLS